MKYLIDTNIWVYYFAPTSPFHLKAKEFIENLDWNSNDYYITTQILIETYVILTSNRVPEPQKPEDVMSRLKQLVRSPINVVGLTVKSMLHLEKLISEYKPKGQKAWDFQIVATMLDQQIKTIYTCNVKDFDKMKEISVINPLNEYE